MFDIDTFIADCRDAVSKDPTHKAAAEVVAKTIKSAVANADENYGLDADDLVVAEIMANEGPRLRRMRFGARGRVKPIRKRTCHITVVLEEQEEEDYFGA